MKHFSALLLMLCLSGIFCIGCLADPIILVKKNPNTTTPVGPRFAFPVSASIDSTSLSIVFSSVVGDATITICHENGNTVYNNTVNTNSLPTVIIAVDTWSEGAYTLTITYNNEYLLGIFDLE